MCCTRRDFRLVLEQPGCQNSQNFQESQNSHAPHVFQTCQVVYT
jgi:hypothetical protein